MIPSLKTLGSDYWRVHTVGFDFVDRASERFHEVKHPCTGERLTVLLESRDEIVGADFSFCQGRTVWIDAKPIDYRRARLLWKELQKLENRPSAIYTHDEHGLLMYDFITQKRTNFYAKPSA